MSLNHEEAFCLVGILLAAILILGYRLLAAI